jgi:hypothetical protein
MTAPRAYIVLPSTLEITAVTYDGPRKAAFEALYLATGKNEQTPVIGGNVIISSGKKGGAAWAFVNTDAAPGARLETKASDPGTLIIDGGALILGPKDENGEFTSVTINEDELRDRIAWDGKSVSAFLEELAVSNNFDRGEVTDEALSFCGCGDCVDELARREQEGGSTAKQAGATLH